MVNKDQNKKLAQVKELKEITKRLEILSTEFGNFGTFGYPLLWLSAVTKEIAQGMAGGSFDRSYIAEKLAKVQDGCNNVKLTA